MRDTANALATAFLAGRLEKAELVDRASHLFGKRWRWVPGVAQRIEATFGSQTRPRVERLASFLLADRGFSRAAIQHELRLPGLVGCVATMNPIEAADNWRVPPICTSAELADWLGVTVGELDWFADLKRLGYKQQSSALQHYHYRVLRKRHGSIRLIESPKPSLKAIQRQILSRILNRVPPHNDTHGFRQGRSIKTFSQPHCGKAVVIKIDLQDFFPSIAMARVQALFRSIGYPERVADLLAGLCSNSAPQRIWKGDHLQPPNRANREVQWMYAMPHLPQGAPTSPALANLCAYRLDCRLSALAETAGAVYTRYADDLAFSGDLEFARGAQRFQVHACATVMEEGFRVHHRKTRVMRRGVSQRLAGVVLNERLNVPRKDFDSLKAVLTNCIRQGPAGQNRGHHGDFYEHLAGRVAYVESINPGRGHKLRKLFDQIQWSVT